MRKIQKRYYVLIVVAVIAFAAILKDMSPSASFEIIKNSENVISETQISYEQTEDDSRININTAGVDELTTLKGVGEKTAEKIIQYREKYGKFEVIEDIMKVPGIGNQKFEDIREGITV